MPFVISESQRRGLGHRIQELVDVAADLLLTFYVIEELRLAAQCVDYTDDGGIWDTMHANKVKYPFMACLAPSLAFLRFRHVFFSLKLVLEQLKRYREQCEAGWNCMRGCKDR